jgi:hypothetical protein
MILSQKFLACASLKKLRKKTWKIFPEPQNMMLNIGLYALDCQWYNDTTPWKDTFKAVNWNLSGRNALWYHCHSSVHKAVLCSLLSYILVGLNWTGHMSFLTGQDRTPKFAGQVVLDRSESGLIFLTFYLTSMGYQFSYDKVPGHKFGVKKYKLWCI